MAHIFEDLNICFLHAPKTGGSTFTEYLKQLSDSHYIENSSHGLPMAFADDMEYITIVRHPYTWYRSYWAHRLRTNWSVNPRDQTPWHISCKLTQPTKGMGFVDFVAWVTHNRTGFATWFFHQYLIPHSKLIIYKTETLDQSVSQRWGDRVEISAKHYRGRNHILPKKIAWPELTQETEFLIWQSEYEFIKEFYE